MLDGTIVVEFTPLAIPLILALLVATCYLVRKLGAYLMRKLKRN